MKYMYNSLDFGGKNKTHACMWDGHQIPQLYFLEECDKQDYSSCVEKTNMHNILYS